MIATEQQTLAARPALAADRPRITLPVRAAQFLLGLGITLFFNSLYLRRAHGLARLRRGRQHLIVCNHVSLLDTIILGGLCWRAKVCPILVLADRAVWQATWTRRALSHYLAFMLDRGRLNPNRLRELQTFGEAGRDFQLVVFPEGTRGDGVNVGPCQPGIYFVAQAARLPLLPVYFENMQCVSTKTGPFHPIGGLRKVEVHFGEPIQPENYLNQPREEFLEFVRQKIAGAKQSAVAEQGKARRMQRIGARQ